MVGEIHALAGAGFATDPAHAAAGEDLDQRRQKGGAERGRSGGGHGAFPVVHGEVSGSTFSRTTVRQNSATRKPPSRSIT